MIIVNFNKEVSTYTLQYYDTYLKLNKMFWHFVPLKVTIFLNPHLVNRDVSKFQDVPCLSCTWAALIAFH